MLRRWRILQLADSAFPTGAYAHSAGFEAFPDGRSPGTSRLGDEKAQEDAIFCALEQTLVTARHQSLPYVHAAWKADLDPQELDAACDATLTGPVGNRASRAQGRAFLVAATEALEAPELADLRRYLPAGLHLCVAFGTVFGRLGASFEETQELYLFGLVRTVLSAAVRLNRLGPFAGQRLQDRAGNRVAQLLRKPLVPWEEAASASPFLDLYQELHPALSTRLFQS